MNVIYEPRFLKEYAELPVVIQHRADRQIKLLLQNPRHPSLRARQMEGYPAIYEARVTKQYRFTYTIKGDTYRLRRIGTHDILKTP